jgi:hypothetical protein
MICMIDDTSLRFPKTMLDPLCALKAPSFFGVNVISGFCAWPGWAQILPTAERAVAKTTRIV